jgi:hypothetical protein
MAHIIRGASDNITTNWIQLPARDYTLWGNGTLDGGTLKLQFGVDGGAGTVVACADMAAAETSATTEPATVTITEDIWVRGVLTGATSPSGVNLWLV